MNPSDEQRERRVSDKEAGAVLRLDGPARYEHFVKTVVDWEAAWGLWGDGWATATDDEGAVFFPLWPARRYAEMCATQDWAGCEARAIPLDDLLEHILPLLRGQGARPAVFPTPQVKGVVVTLQELEDALRREATKYGVGDE
jgi:hypothetical protein